MLEFSRVCPLTTSQKFNYHHSGLRNLKNQLLELWWANFSLNFHVESSRGVLWISSQGHPSAKVLLGPSLQAPTDQGTE